DEDEGGDVLRRREERRRAAAGCEGQAAGGVRGGEGAGGNRGLFVAARLVRAGHAEAAQWRADLQQSGRGESLGQAGRLVQGRPRLISTAGRESFFARVRTRFPIP